MSREELPSFIIIDPPLPCGMVKSGGICGQPATKGRLRQIRGVAGKWEIIPICRDCSMAAMSVLWGGQPKSMAMPTPEPQPTAEVPPLPSQLDSAMPQRELNKKRYVAQFMGQNTDKFEDFAFWTTEKQAIGHVLMTISSNPRVKAGRVFDQIDQRVIGSVHYKS